uniref:THAP-type domain-containing protein n=1 Tax=Timema poppense TaxID=170557 RepID=A0A7R9DMK1_TIMPO|nr:unnamed protein product [Timema poppensis]
MVLTCCAVNCTNKHGDAKTNSPDESLSFHKWPLNNKEKSALWLSNCRRDNWEPSKFSSLCSEHFTDADFIYCPGSHMRRLKPESVPMMFNLPEHLKYKRSTHLKSPKKRSLSSSDAEDAQQPSSSGKEERLISYTDPSPSTSQGNLVEPEIFVKEEPYVFDNEQKHYQMAFVDFSATESYSHDELSGSRYGIEHIPETYYGVETKSGVEPSNTTQSEHAIEKVVSLAAGTAHGSSQRSTQGSTRQDNARCSEEKEQDKTSDPNESSSNHTKSRIRVMELTLEQLTKEHEAKMREHEAKMKEHEANMIEHETRMSNHKKMTELQVYMIKKEHERKFTEIEFRYQDLQKKSDWDGKVQKLTIMNLKQKISTWQSEHQGRANCIHLWCKS